MKAQGPGVALGVAALALGWAVIYINRTLLYPLLPVIGEDLHLTGAQQGAIASAYFLPYVAMQLPAGILGDRLGLKRVLMALYLVTGLGVALVGLLARSYPLLLVFMAVQGLGAGGYFPTAYAIVINSVPPRWRALGTAFIGNGMSLGLALGLLLAVPLSEATGSWRAPYLIFTLPVFAMVLAFALMLKEGSPLSRPGLAGFGAVLRNRNLMPINAAAFCALWGLQVTLVWGASYLAAERGLSLARAGAFTAIIALTSIPGAILLGRLSDRWGRKPVAVSLSVLAAATIFLLGAMRSPWLLLLLLGAYGFWGSYALNPVATAWTGDHLKASGQALGTGIALYNTSAMLAAIVAPVASGWFRDLTGSLAGAYYLGAGIVFLGALFQLLPKETVKRTG